MNPNEGWNSLDAGRQPSELWHAEKQKKTRRDHVAVSTTRVWDDLCDTSMSSTLCFVSANAEHLHNVQNYFKLLLILHYKFILIVASQHTDEVILLPCQVYTIIIMIKNYCDSMACSAIWDQLRLCNFKQYLCN